VIPSEASALVQAHGGCASPWAFRVSRSNNGVAWNNGLYLMDVTEHEWALKPPQNGWNNEPSHGNRSA
jgi:hypothetical protein